MIVLGYLELCGILFSFYLKIRVGWIIKYIFFLVVDVFEFGWRDKIWMSEEVMWMEVDDYIFIFLKDGRDVVYELVVFGLVEMV